jgi:hypothetical protein
MQLLGRRATLAFVICRLLERFKARNPVSLDSDVTLASVMFSHHERLSDLREGRFDTSSATMAFVRQWHLDRSNDVRPRCLEKKALSPASVSFSHHTRFKDSKLGRVPDQSLRDLSVSPGFPRYTQNAQVG